MSQPSSPADLRKLADQFTLRCDDAGMLAKALRQAADRIEQLKSYNFDLNERLDHALHEEKRAKDTLAKAMKVVNAINQAIHETGLMQALNALEIDHHG